MPCWEVVSLVHDMNMPPATAETRLQEASTQDLAGVQGRNINMSDHHHDGDVNTM